MAGLHLCVVECAHHFDGAHAADASIEFSTVQHRIDVRAEKQYWQLLRARAPAEDVSRSIDANLKARLLHETDDVFAGGHVGLREANASDTAFGIPAEFTQFLKCALETLRVDVKL